MASCFFCCLLGLGLVSCGGGGDARSAGGGEAGSEARQTARQLIPAGYRQVEMVLSHGDEFTLTLTCSRDASGDSVKGEAYGELSTARQTFITSASKSGSVQLVGSWVQMKNGRQNAELLGELSVSVTHHGSTSLTVELEEVFILCPQWEKLSEESGALVSLEGTLAAGLLLVDDEEIADLRGSKVCLSYTR